MEKHYNIYYLFLEDRERNILPERRYEEIRQVLEAFYGKSKPP